MTAIPRRGALPGLPAMRETMRGLGEHEVNARFGVTAPAAALATVARIAGMGSVPACGAMSRDGPIAGRAMLPARGAAPSGSAVRGARLHAEAEVRRAVPGSAGIRAGRDPRRVL